MICVPYNPVLLVTPTGGQDISETGNATDPWLSVRAKTVGEALRHVRQHQPRVLVVNVSTLSYGSSACDTAMRVIHEVRRRLSGVSIIVLGASEDPSMEQAARRQGATIYLTVSGGNGLNEARRYIRALHPRDGPVNAHGPPHSGVPPRRSGS